MGSSYMRYRLQSNCFLWWGYCKSALTEASRLSFVRKEKSSSEGEESDKGEYVGAVFLAVGLVVFIASEEILTPTCSAKFLSTVFGQLLEINSDENQRSGHYKRTMTRNTYLNLQMNGD